MTGRRGGLIDVPGLRIGHCTADTNGSLTGTTVVLAPPGGMVAGVDVRGGAPGTLETDLLAPTAVVDRIHALVLTGGSAYGLAAVTGVVDALAERGIGFSVGDGPTLVVPIVPAAVVFDLGRGGSFGSRPDAAFGRAAVEDALTASRASMLKEGLVGAGTGVCAGQLKGGIGQASATLSNGTTVSAVVVVNATGSAYNPRTGELWAAPLMQPEDGPALRPPVAEEQAELAELASRIRAALQAGRPQDAEGAVLRNTTLGVVATDAVLTKTQCSKLAAIAHDGLARAVNPVHTMFDGDLFFGVATGERTAPDPGQMYQLLAAAADVVTRAVGRAMLAARTVSTVTGSWRSYLDVAPSSLRR